MTPEERAHDAYTLIMRTLNDTEVQHAIEHQIYHAIRAAVAAERAELLQAIVIAASHLPVQPDLAERVLSAVLEGVKK